MSYSERFAIREKIERSVKMATTYLRKASDALYWSGERPLPVSYWTLLDQVLATADEIIKELPDDFFEATEVSDIFGLGGLLDRQHNLSDAPLEAAEKVVASLRSRRERASVSRMIARLEDTRGRTDEEAIAYRAKAAELRAKHGMDQTRRWPEPMEATHEF